MRCLHTLRTERPVGDGVVYRTQMDRDFDLKEDTRLHKPSMGVAVPTVGRSQIPLGTINELVAYHEAENLGTEMKKLDIHTLPQNTLDLENQAKQDAADALLDAKTD